ncbi:MAG TPA: PEP/pyruvate-binding domain-containing protein [Chloroflexota bacterium]|nr:PEP/pyruvate-binding domain-containing protein [Chloroflexota bacterium]
MTAYAIPLDAPDVTLATAGGKAANLRALLCAGFPVPRGFVVPTTAYRTFVTASGLAERILALVRGAAPDDPGSWSRRSSLRSRSVPPFTLRRHVAFPARRRIYAARGYYIG